MFALRMIIVGISSALIVAFLGRLWARWIPDTVGRKSREQLKREYGGKVFTANVLSALGLLAALSLYYFKLFNSKDWRPFGLGMGLTAMLPVSFLFLSSCAKGRQTVREAFAYYAISQKTPLYLLFAVLVLFISFGIIALVAMF